MKLEDFDFYLPKKLIAITPAEDREKSRLLYIPEDGDFKDLQFSDLLSLLKPGDLLVLNDSKVMPVQVSGKLMDDQGSIQPIDITLVVDCGEEVWDGVMGNVWQFYGRPSRSLAGGLMMKLGNGDLDGKESLAGKIGYRDEKWYVHFPGLNKQRVLEYLEVIGTMPIPPYIVKERKKRTSIATDQLAENDRKRYQTIYARNSGSVAAPTAGLHFSEDLIIKIKKLGVDIAYLTLHVGLGTFAPVKDLGSHVMHSEEYFLDNSTCELINRTRQAGGRIIAVGTTTLRVLETVATKQNIGAADKCKIIAEAGETDIFIKPGYHFKLVDALVTNFHLPKSTLMMLVSAFAGHGRVLDAYKHAIDKEYRFFSYGDACFMEKKSLAHSKGFEPITS